METLNSLGLTLISFVFVLGVLIFIHEFGHHLVATLLGIRVETFSLGFGPRLLGFRMGDTDYRVSLIPLGGYVKMTGENPDEELTGSKEEFLSRPKLHRFAVVIAGPLMNLGLAVVLLAVGFMNGTDVPVYEKQPGVLGAVFPESPASTAGLQQGDTIVAIDGDPTPTWKDVQFSIATSPNLQREVEYVRSGETIKTEILIASRGELGIGYIGIYPYVPYFVSELQPDSPALRADLRAGDEVISVSRGDEIKSGFYAIANLVSGSESEPLEFQIRRDGEILTKNIVPEIKDGRTQVGAFLKLDTDFEQYGLLGALKRSVNENIEMAELTFVTVGRLLTGRASINQMSGPIEIARFSGMAAQQGLLSLITFMAIISLQLGLLNLLPIPILDGGVIALMAIESVIGRDLSLHVKERIIQVGLVFIVLLMGVVIFNDIAKQF